MFKYSNNDALIKNVKLKKKKKKMHVGILVYRLTLHYLLNKRFINRRIFFFIVNSKATHYSK